MDPGKLMNRSYSYDLGEIGYVEPPPAWTLVALGKIMVMGAAVPVKLMVLSVPIPGSVLVGEDLTDCSLPHGTSSWTMLYLFELKGVLQ